MLDENGMHQLDAPNNHETEMADYRRGALIAVLLILVACFFAHSYLPPGM